MADERQDLLDNQATPAPSIVGDVPAAPGVSCNRGTVASVLSVFVALLLAGQVATVYFVVQQRGQISKLQDFTTELKLKMLSEQHSRNHPPPQKKMQMAMANMPLAFVDVDQEAPRVNLTKLENTAKKSTNIEDHIKYLMAKDNPQLILPEFNDSIIENLNELRKSMDNGAWQSFKTWMHRWLLFHSVQNSLQKEPEASLEEGSFITAAPVVSKCQMEASGKSGHSILLGAFLPKCTDNGEYQSRQCHHSIGYCWCVYKNGTEIPGTRTRDKLDCNSVPVPEGSTLGWMNEENP
ncbi:HLA class II histocompatibility antigen gamma chain [Ambystoma mexicanum]|uniref:HLA class II histocompatibility antigen gamma chain n=1 Tax=Ambystoma mexicanum TaxID=8296 RepID=UPI0037E787D9